MTLDSGHSTILVLLDLSAAFDAVSHRILLRRLGEIGLKGPALQWMTSFLSSCSQTISLGLFQSKAMELTKGVPRGSCLSPTLFNIYVAPLASLLRTCGFTLISYADDTQLLFSFNRSTPFVQSTFSSGMIAISNWMSSNFLQQRREDRDYSFRRGSVAVDTRVVAGSSGHPPCP